MKNTNVKQTAIPLPVWRRAASIIADQSHVPLSPGDMEDGNINLCAAACLASAGLQEAFSEREAKLFETKLIRTRSFSVVDNAFETIGWSQDLCRTILRFNDSLPPERRKANVLQLFRSPRSVDLSSFSQEA